MTDERQNPSSTSGASGVPATRAPSVAEILEFARRSRIINTETSLGTLMENMSMLEPRGALAQAGWGIVNRGFGIVTSSD